MYASKSTKSGEVIEHLRHYFVNYSVPKRLISDRGTCFTSKDFSEFLEEKCVKHVLIDIGTPRANGQIERFNRDLTPMLSKLCADSEEWTQVLE